jgi:membrane protein required for colicin V production
VTLPTLDWIFAGVLLLSLVLGAWRGLVFEVMSLVSWAAAFALAQWLAADVAQRLPMGGAGDMVRYAAGFVVVFVAVLILGGLLAALTKKLLTSVGLRPVDRVLGAAFGLVRGMLLLLLATVLAAMTPFKSSAAWQESTGVSLSLAVIKGIRPALPRDLDKFLPV